MFTYDDLLAILRRARLDEMADRWETWRGVIEPMIAADLLPLMGQKAIEKGLWQPASLPVASGGFTAAEQAAIPLLRELDQALRSGGSEAANALWRQLVSTPETRAVLAAVA